MTMCQNSGKFRTDRTNTPPPPPLRDILQDNFTNFCPFCIKVEGKLVGGGEVGSFFMVVLFLDTIHRYFDT